MRRHGWTVRWLIAGAILIGSTLIVATAATEDAFRVYLAALGLAGLITFAHACELAFGIYAVAFSVAAVRYWRLPPLRNTDEQRPPDPLHTPPAAIVYLCCGDVDEEALSSLARLRYPGPLLRIVHDDSVDPQDQRRVDETVAAVESESGNPWRVLRRPDHDGGKPGALNYVLRHTADEHAIFLIADNDSYAEDPDLLTRLAPEFGDDSVAGVQLRNRGRSDVDDEGLFGILASAVDIFDAFMSGLFAWLWMPFVGHNAVLRTRDVTAAGGFTPGAFADDIDLTARLTIRGKRIVYRRDIAMYERHPDNYRAFCLRSTKWAHGCAQVLRMHFFPFLRNSRVSPKAKLGFLLFSGFYLIQAAMLGYMVLVLIALPGLIGETWVASWWALLIATCVPVATFLPVIAYLLKDGRHLPFRKTLLACSITYGSMDLWTIAGLSSGLRNRPRTWVPTNRVNANGHQWIDWFHLLVGIAFLAGPLLLQPQLLLFPLTWVFVGKYLFVPSVATHYVRNRDPAGEPSADSRPSAATATKHLGILLVGLASLAATGPARAATESEVAAVRIAGNEIHVAGEPYIVRGIHYSPWRPGTGPGRGFDYPSAIELAEDLDLVRSLHANTILAYDPPGRLLDLAAVRGLRVLYAFHVFWWQLATEGEDAIEELESAIASRVRELDDHPALLGFMIGNEVPGWVTDRLGADGVAALLSRLRERVRASGSALPVCHGNWPLTRTFDLDRDMDFLCYNVYPFFPTEVAVRGYEDFVRDEIIRRSGGRPVVITEFGLNTIEASEQVQGEVLLRCWHDLLSAGAAGGVVFAFADEWWKNYDGPVTPPDWWRRQPEPDDHLTGDADPEEHYGLVEADRTPKPAFAVVRQMFWENELGPAWSAFRRVARWAVAVGAAVMVILAVWVPMRGRGGRIGPAVILGCSIASSSALDADASEPFSVEIRAAVAGGEFGTGIGGGGDFDADGFGDFAVGSPYASPGSAFVGAVRLYLGGPGFFATPIVDAEIADLSLSDDAPDSHFGFSVAHASDYDGDGFDDLAIGARFDDTAASDAGAAFVYFGGPTLGLAAPLILEGEAAHDWFAQSVASAGDVNRDGFADVLVGAPYNDGNGSAAGRAYVFFGGDPMDASADVILSGDAQANAHFGWSVAGAGDVNQDGFDDVVVGARLFGSGPSRARGRAYVFFGGAPMDSSPDWVLTGEAKNDWFGESVAGAGDMNGDGFDDVIVGAIYADPPGAEDGGKAYVFLGGDAPDDIADAVVSGPHGDAQLGNAVAGGSDLNGDGRSDAIVGLHFADGPSGEFAAGAAWILHGGAVLDGIPDEVVAGDAPDEHMGERVATGASPGSTTGAVAIAGASLAADLAVGAGSATVSGWPLPIPVPGPAASIRGLLIASILLAGCFAARQIHTGSRRSRGA